MNIYEHCPVLESERFKLRLIEREDADDLLKVYGDETAAALFNSDNCHGNDFRYSTLERMRQAVDFWIEAYSKGWFVRLSIVEKASNVAIGTVEVFLREAEDFFTRCCLIRIDLRSDREKSGIVREILTTVDEAASDLFGCDMTAVKAPPFAAERLQALELAGFGPTDEKLIGHDGTRYGDYYYKRRDS